MHDAAGFVVSKFDVFSQPGLSGSSVRAVRTLVKVICRCYGANADLVQTSFMSLQLRTYRRGIITPGTLEDFPSVHLFMNFQIAFPKCTKITFVTFVKCFFLRIMYVGNVFI